MAVLAVWHMLNGAETETKWPQKRMPRTNERWIDRQTDRRKAQINWAMKIHSYRFVRSGAFLVKRKKKYRRARAWSDDIQYFDLHFNATISGKYCLVIVCLSSTCEHNFVFRAVLRQSQMVNECLICEWKRKRMHARSLACRHPFGHSTLILNRKLVFYIWSWI